MTAATTKPSVAEPAASVRLPAHLLDATVDESALRHFLAGLPGIDPVGLERRAAQLATRSLKRETKRGLIDLALSMVDLTCRPGSGRRRARAR